jgi:NAD(P)-dependent dehydrogenase (short-subunit alcohol dehydrogenase family)
VKKVIVVGANGELGLEVCRQLTNVMDVIPISRGDITFGAVDEEIKIKEIMDFHTPDFIVNCTGKFGGNNADFLEIFNSNVKSTWIFLNHFINVSLNKPVRYVAIGSSAYREGRREYMLYSSSKAALMNLMQGAQEHFANSNLSLSLINLPGLDSKMRQGAKGNNNSQNLMSVETAVNRILELGLMHSEGKNWDVRD